MLEKLSKKFFVIIMTFPILIGCGNVKFSNQNFSEKDFNKIKFKEVNNNCDVDLTDQYGQEMLSPNWACPGLIINASASLDETLKICPTNDFSVGAKVIIYSMFNWELKKGIQKYTVEAISRSIICSSLYDLSL